MNQIQELLSASQKLSQAVSSDISIMDVFSNYMRKRAQVDEEFASNISSFLKNDINTRSSSSMTLILDEINAIYTQHRSISGEIASHFLPPITSFNATLQREQKGLEGLITKTTDSVKSVEKKLFAARSNLDKANLESIYATSLKSDKKRRSIRTLEAEVAIVEEEQNEKAKSIKEVEFPKLVDRVSDIDYSIRTTIKSAMLNLVHTEIESTKRLLSDLEALELSSERYEPAIETQNLARSLGAAQAGKKTFAIALCHFDGGLSDDLVFGKGQMIEVLQQHPSGWWKGELNGRIGIFPMTYVKILDDIQGDITFVGESFEVDCNFKPQGEKDLALEFGDVVFVESVSSGWCVGYNIANGKHGRFPSKVVKQIRMMKA